MSETSEQERTTMRPQLTRPGWSATRPSPGIAADESDHLRDDVVAMFRDSFDEDGLDFLRKGPRTPQERLAYAQGVGSDAHLAAQPAPADVQRRFADYGIIDRDRYFIGPDRAAYVRGGDSGEPGYAATRRSFESAIGGYAPASLAQALGEVADAVDGQPGRLGNVSYLRSQRPVSPVLFAAGSSRPKPRHSPVRRSGSVGGSSIFRTIPQRTCHMR